MHGNLCQSFTLDRHAEHYDTIMRPTQFRIYALYINIIFNEKRCLRVSAGKLMARTVDISERGKVEFLISSYIRKAVSFRVAFGRGAVNSFVRGTVRTSTGAKRRMDLWDLDFNT